MAFSKGRVAIALLLALWVPSSLGQVDVPSNKASTSARGCAASTGGFACDTQNSVFWQRVQCTTQACWCVNVATGAEIEVTRSDLPERELPCAHSNITLAMCDMVFLGFAYEKGSCSQKSAIACSGGNPFPFLTRTACEQAFTGMKPCLGDRKFYEMFNNSSSLLSPQTYIPYPSCDENGDYEAFQCRPRDPRLTQSCACVNSTTGKEDEDQSSCGSAPVPLNPVSSTAGSPRGGEAALDATDSSDTSVTTLKRPNTTVDTTEAFVGAAVVLALASLAVVSVYALRRRTEVIKEKMIKMALTGESVEMLPRFGSYDCKDLDLSVPEISPIPKSSDI